MKVDDLYMDNLLEYVFDDNLFVTYKFISVKLKVHVNLAKQMLYHFYDTEKAKGKSICATYYLSGMAPQTWISSLNSDSQLEGNPADSYGDKDAYLVMLCKDFELEEMKRKFSRLYSVHVYGLSSSSLHTMNMLNKVLEEPLRDDDGNAPVHYGPISCKAAFEYREDPRLAPLIKNVQEVKASVELAKVKHDLTHEKSDKTAVKNTPQAKSPSKDNTNERSSSTAKKTTATDSSSVGDKGRLKNMFAAAATRPKPKVEEITKKPSSTSSASSKKPAYAKKEATKKQQQKEKEVTRKRKRIRDVFSSSDEEEETKVSDDEDGLPESPIPKKRQQIESDSDEDFQAETKKPASPPPVTPVRSESGKRRISKTVPRRHVDDQGFLVTVMEQVMVSESDHSDEESKDSISKVHTEENSSSKQKDAIPEPKNSRKELSVTKKEQPSKKVSNINPPKKQATLTSFFQKK